MGGGATAARAGRGAGGRGVTTIPRVPSVQVSFSSVVLRASAHAATHIQRALEHTHMLSIGNGNNVS